MSSTKRVLSGNLANLMRIGATLFAQIALVPIYLHKWSPAKYGIWTAAIAYIALLSIFDYGFQNYLEGEFLRLGSDRHVEVRRKLWSTFPIGLIQGIIEFVFTVVIVAVGALPYVLGAREPADIAWANVLGTAILPIVFLSSTFSSGVGILNRVVNPYGYYSKLAWWGVATVLVSSLAPSMVAFFGGDIAQAAWSYSISMLILNLAQLTLYYKILKKHDLMPVRPDFREGFRDWVGSLVLTIKATADLLRNQGSTLVLVPLVGPAGLTSFKTMRTVANVLLQGLGTVTGPILPEMMRYVNRRDQGKVEASFSVVWLTLLAVFMPGALVLQMIAPKFYSVWTHHRLELDPVFFAIVSLSVLVYGIGQPAFAIIRGNNITKTQFVSAIAAGVITVGGMFVFVKPMGLRGAAVALLVAEFVSTVIFVEAAKKWLTSNDLTWPRRSFGWVVAATLATAGIFAVLVVWKGHVIVVGLLGLAVQGITALGYWSSLPLVVREHAQNVLRRKKARPQAA